MDRIEKKEHVGGRFKILLRVYFIKELIISLILTESNINFSLNVYSHSLQVFIEPSNRVFINGKIFNNHRVTKQGKENIITPIRAACSVPRAASRR